MWSATTLSFVNERERRLRRRREREELFVALKQPSSKGNDLESEELRTELGVLLLLLSSAVDDRSIGCRVDRGKATSDERTAK